MKGFRNGTAPTDRPDFGCKYEDTLEVWRPAEQNKELQKVVGDVKCALIAPGSTNGNTKILAPPELTVLRGDVLKLKRRGRIDPNSTTVLEFEPLAGRGVVCASHQEIFVNQIPEIDFFATFDTHRVGRYKGWVIIQPTNMYVDGEIRCYRPEELTAIETENELIIGDFEYVTMMYQTEWAAENLNEIIDFIDFYSEE